MTPNDSPWLHQLNSERDTQPLSSNLKTDVAIVGAGIAGIMTAYFVLKNTHKKVVVVEGSKVAHGATGHNAGQVVANFERELYDIVEEYGLKMATEGEELIRSAWILLEEIYQDAKLTTPMSTILGYEGYASIDRLLEELKNNHLRDKAGYATYPVYIADDAPEIDKIPQEYKDLYTFIPRKDIMSLLETEDDQYVAVTADKKGVVNSAMLVEEIVGYLLATYEDRFTLVEHTHIHKVILEKEHGALEAEKHSIQAKHIVLCTNGFVKFHIENHTGEDIDTRFHQLIHGSVGYMAGYLEEMNRPPTALAYFDTDQIKKGHADDTFHEPPYFYLTRRPYELEKNEHHNLICVGGPEVLVEKPSIYSHREEYSEEMFKKIDEFIKKTHRHAPKDHLEYRFLWHGLLGYTPSGLRVIGHEPKNKILLYNLGCNGVGILPSIYGGKRISQLLKGEKLPPSIFDPKESLN